MTIKQVAIKAAKEAGKHIVRLSKKKIRYTLKHRHDIQAEADLLSEKTIIATIKKYFPDHGILAEESGAQKSTSDYQWIIDPVDGTVNYSRGLDDYCISIAVLYKGTIILGLNFQPHFNRLYIAERGKGAFLNNRPLRVSTESKLINTVAATENSHSLPSRLKNLKLLLKISPHVRHVRIYGSSALDMMKIADAQMDIAYKSECNFWDYAAGIIILEEAGGKVTDFAGKPITQKSKSIVASNSLIHNAALKLLRN